MKESLDFSFNGLSSREMGVIQVSTDNGLFEEGFLPSRSISEEKIRGNDKPYLYGVTYEAKTFPLSLYFDGKLDNMKLRQLAAWLNVETYQPLSFEDYPDRIFYCMPVNDSQYVHNGLKQGYLNLTMRCDSPYSYSPEFSSKTHTFENNMDGTVIEYTNGGDTQCSPLLYVEKIGDGDISILNLNFNGREFKFTDLVDGEKLVIDNEKQTIETDLPLTYRYDNFNNMYLVMIVGVNRLLVTGDCKIQFKSRFKTLQ
ncbi:distal tail protein Dit [Bacillus infantis]|uniref:distal tail protein Dit n=1 Tax=Bacillus infantis TaxID=324767 RepID=UPI00209D1C7D|nr:distal tail protein Dit [Bacillus infantis]MCP1159458.1 phage tail family protein [Bacillus infantis]